MDMFYNMEVSEALEVFMCAATDVCANSTSRQSTVVCNEYHSCRVSHLL